MINRRFMIVSTVLRSSGHVERLEPSNGFSSLVFRKTPHPAIERAPLLASHPPSAYLARQGTATRSAVMRVQDTVRTGDTRLDRDLEVLRIAEFVTADEARELLDWALLMEPYLRGNGVGRAFLRVHQLPQQPALHALVAERVRVRVAGHDSSVLEPVLNNYLSIISTSGAVQPHTDSAPEGTRHLRCNLFLQISEGGGRPIIDGTAFEVVERGLLCFFPSRSLHASEPTTGPRKRVMLSFGLLVPRGFEFQPN